MANYRRTLLEVFGLSVWLEGVVLYGNDNVLAVVVQLVVVECSHEVDQRVWVSEKHVDYIPPPPPRTQQYFVSSASRPMLDRKRKYTYSSSLTHVHGPVEI